MRWEGWRPHLVHVARAYMRAAYATSAALGSGSERSNHDLLDPEAHVGIPDETMSPWRIAALLSFLWVHPCAMPWVVLTSFLLSDSPLITASVRTCRGRDPERTSHDTTIHETDTLRYDEHFYPDVHNCVCASLYHGCASLVLKCRRGETLQTSSPLSLPHLLYMLRQGVMYTAHVLDAMSCNVATTDCTILLFALRRGHYAFRHPSVISVNPDPASEACDYYWTTPASASRDTNRCRCRCPLPCSRPVTDPRSGCLR